MREEDDMKQATHKVIIIGAGIGGLSAAHELLALNAKQDAVRFEVSLYERSQVVGGKAASQWPTATRDGKTVTLPGEHGFRFFPHFYRHMTQTLREIEIPEELRYDGKKSVFDRLVPSTKAGLADRGTVHQVSRPTAAGPQAFKELAKIVANGLRLEPKDALRYGFHLLKFLSTSDERRLGEYDAISWHDFLKVDDEKYGDEFMKLVVMGSVNLSAMKADEGSARTIGNISMQMMFDFAPDDPPHPADAVLNAPTDKSLLEPWQAHLERGRARFNFERALTGIRLGTDGRITSLVLQSPDNSVEEVAVGDASVILAVPIEALVPLLTDELADADANLDNLRKLHEKSPTRPMVGAQYFLKDKLNVIDGCGHVTFPKSAYALTAVSQSAFWHDALPYFKGTGVKDVLSVIASQWDKIAPNRGDLVGVIAADHTSGKTLLDEIWAQVAEGLGDKIAETLVVERHLDANVQMDRGLVGNATPLLVHPVGGYLLRPPARVEIPNFFLAADFVRTKTDLASMESANEAARRAVRAIAEDRDIAAEYRPQLWSFGEGNFFAAAKRLDRLLFNAGLPHAMDVANPGRWLGRLTAVLAAKGFDASVYATDKVAGGAAVSVDTSTAKSIAKSIPDLTAELFDAKGHEAVRKGFEQLGTLDSLALPETDEAFAKWAEVLLGLEL